MYGDDNINFDYGYGKEGKMSANNYILIKWTGFGYSISEMDADTGFKSRINPLIKNTKNLEEAVRRANQYQSSEANNVEIEYGLQIIPRKKKRK